jgi:hypothetical protein
MKMTHETSLKLRSLNDSGRDIIKGTTVSYVVGDMAVPVGDSTSACIVHWNEETTKEVV